MTIKIKSLSKTITKKTRVINKNSNKLSFTFGDNPELIGIITELEGFFRGMSRSEIAKLALIELLNLSYARNNKSINLSKKTDENIKKSYLSGNSSILSNSSDIAAYFDKF